MTMVYGNKGDARIANLGAWLKTRTEDEIIIRTTYVSGGWHDAEFDANRNGYGITRIQYKPWQEKHEFAEAYRLWKK